MYSRKRTRVKNDVPISGRSASPTHVCGTSAWNSNAFKSPENISWYFPMYLSSYGESTSDSLKND